MQFKLLFLFLLVNSNYYSASSYCIRDYIHEKFFSGKETALQIIEIHLPEKPSVCIDNPNGFCPLESHPNTKEIDVETVPKKPRKHASGDEFGNNENKHASHFVKLLDGSISYTTALCAVIAVFALIVIIYEWFYMPEILSFKNKLEGILSKLKQSQNDVRQMPKHADSEPDRDDSQSDVEIPPQVSSISNFGEMTSSESIFNYLQEMTEALKQSGAVDAELLTTEFLKNISDFIYGNELIEDFGELVTPDYLLELGKENEQFQSQVSGADNNRVNVNVVVFVNGAHSSPSNMQISDVIRSHQVINSSNQVTDISHQVTGISTQVTDISNLVTDMSTQMTDTSPQVTDITAVSDL